MKIGDVIERMYPELHSMCRNVDTVGACHRTSEDILHDTLMKALRKFRERDVDYETGYYYIRTAFLMELHFNPKRSNLTEVQMDEWDIPDVAIQPDYF